MAQLSLSELNEKHFDVAIIGGGINGASTAQHLSAAGYTVLLVDQGDFADGATSRSSRLLHCGLRHLASGSGIWDTLLHPARLLRSFSTTYQDMAARDEIVSTIPDRVKAFNFCLPIYKDDPYAPWHMDLAFAALRLLSPMGVPLDYRRYKPTDSGNVPIAPWLRDSDRLSSIAVFREYQFDWPERIALDALFDARRMGADIRNYTKVEDLTPGTDGKPWELALRSVEGDQTGHVKADLVFNLAGAWIDSVARGTGKPTAQKCLGLKGVHIAVQLPEEFNDWGVFAYNSIGEPLYCLPWHGLHYIGLTRTPFEGDASEINATDAEIEWMINETNRCMPDLAITGSDVLFSWAGVNPLTFDENEPKGSRDIVVHDMANDGLPGLVALTGGAVVTHRRMARKLVKVARAKMPPSGEEQVPGYRPREAVDDSNAPRLVSDAGYVRVSDVEKVVRDEQPSSLGDIIMRRLGVGWTHDQGKDLARQIAETAAPVLDWDAERIDREVLAYENHLKSARRCPGQ